MFASRSAKGLSQACQGSMLQRFDGSNILVHQLARFFEIEPEDEAIQDHVALILRELGERRSDFAESEALVDRVQRVDRFVSLDVAPLELRMSILEPEVIHDLGMRNLEEPGEEFALGLAAEPIEAAECAEVDLLKKVFSRGLDAQACQEVAENSAIGCLIQPGERGDIPLARSIQQFAVLGRGLVLIEERAGHLEVVRPPRLDTAGL
jgi:hypothetical protein